MTIQLKNLCYWSLSLIMVLFSNLNVFAVGLSNSDLIGLRENYVSWAGDRPLGDINRNNIGNQDQNQRLVFSESVSYALFSHVLPIPGEDEKQVKQRFLEYWQWTKSNLLRKKITQVYSWDFDPKQKKSQYHKWIAMPDDLKDNLMAWRWVEKIQNTPQSGVIYQTIDSSANPDIKMWQDGTDVATDGDLLVAYALYLANKRGWGDELLTEAQAIVKELRKKTVIEFKAGEMVNAQKNIKPNHLYSGSFNEGEVDGKITFPDKEQKVIAWQGVNNYLGFSYEKSPISLSNLDKIELQLKGQLADDASLDFRVEDMEQRVYRTSPLDVTEKTKTYFFSKTDFSPKPLYEKDKRPKTGPLDWSQVKSLQLQIAKRYSQYSNTYDYKGEGHIQFLNVPNRIAWEGNRCYVGFSYNDNSQPHDNRWLNLTNLSQVIVKMKGNGSVDFRLIDKNNVTYTTGNQPLNDELTTYTFDRKDFTFFEYSQKKGALDWSKISNLQFQISSIVNARVELESVEVKLSTGQKYVITANSSADSESYVALETINLKLAHGQTDAHNGYHLSANAKQDPLLNVSYFMPFAYRVFKKIDPEGATLWDNLLDQTYRDLDTSLTVTLHDTSGNAVKSNGALFPNWYRLDWLTGHPTDAIYQQDDYKFGYDAFRTIWFLAYDYHLSRDDERKRNKQVLAKVYPFFKNQLAQQNRIYPEYVISGLQAADYETPFGFYAVYLTLFRVMGDQESENILLKKYEDYRRSSGNRVWMKSNDAVFEGGKVEYFTNFWTFFGGYLYQLISKEL